MHMLPQGMAAILKNFRQLFRLSVWQHVQVLMIGAILCQGARRVSTILRIMGLSQERRFEKYHRVFNRAKWNGVNGAKILLGLLIQLLPTSFPLQVLVDETIERRNGRKIKAKGCYRDACRSTKENIITCYGLKWLCLMLIVPLPWCKRPWALPFMTLLVSSKKYDDARGRKHKTSIDWTIVAVRVISRWLRRPFILIGDGGFACIRLGHACRKRKVTLVSRLRLDAALYNHPSTPIKGQRGRHREKGGRAPSLKQFASDTEQLWKEIEVNWYGGEKRTVKVLSSTNLWYSSGEKPLPIRWVLVKHPDKVLMEAFFTTDLAATPDTIINQIVLRWNVEVTFEEMRAQLGMETQRQWSEKAIARTTPCLMALFSLICLFAIEMLKSNNLPIQSTAWYSKESEATFSDVIAFVRRAIWVKSYFNDSRFDGDYVRIRQDRWESLLDQLSRAA